MNNESEQTKFHYSEQHVTLTYSVVRAILDTFSQHVDDVDRLITFDREVMQIAIGAVEELHHRLVKNMGIHNDQLNGARTLQILKGVRNNGSLKPRYSLILNQAIVLLVSYFGSAVEDIFSAAVTTSLRAGTSSRLMKEDMKLTVAEIMEVVANPEDAFVPLLIEKKDLSFQDMQAIHRAFREYLGVEIERNSSVNNIILSQACRHVIVHAGGEITSRLIRQVKSAFPRDLKSQLDSGTVVQFTQEEVQTVAQSMKQYLSDLARNTERGLQNVG